MLRFTPIYGSLLVLLVLFLAYRVTLFRRREKVGLNEKNGSPQLRCAVRAHANAVENIPLALLLMLFLELNHLTPWLFHAFGVTLLLGRALHAWGLSGFSGMSPGRYYGTLLTWLSMAGMALVNVLIVVTR